MSEYTDGFDFDRLLSPIAVDAFFQLHWERRPLSLLRNRSDYYAGLFAPTEVDTLLYFTRPLFSSAAAGSGQQAPHPTVLRGLLQESAAPGGDLRLSELRKLYSQGQTILLHGLQFRSPNVARLCRNLELSLRHPVNVNLYLTPAHAQGFSPHYDDHDVFIIQIDGVKHWRLYGSGKDLPLKSDEQMVPRERLGAAQEEVILHPGDLLYMPRGHVHEAFTTEQPSLHLTIGVEVFRWADLLASAVACLSQKERGLRQAVPVGLLCNDRAALLEQQFRQVLELLSNRAELEDALAQLGERLVGQLPELPDGHFTEPLEWEDVGLDTLLCRRPGLLCQVLDEGESVSIVFPGNRLRGPEKIAPALRFLASHPGCFTARALPDELGDAAKLTLIRRLIREGLLTRAAASELRGAPSGR